MSGHNIQKQIHDGEGILSDPGNAGVISVFKSPSIVNLTSAGAETRTLGRPTKQNVEVTLHMIVDAGDITVTVTGGYNENGDTTFVFSDVGQFITLRSMITTGGVYFWRKVSDYSTGNLGIVTATAAELNQAADESANSEIVITTRPILAADSGKTFYLSLVGGFTSTLPAPALGLRYRFIVAVAPTTAYIIVTNGGANILYGMMEERAGGAGVAGAGQDTFNFVASQAIIADWVEMYSDGTNWYYHGMVNVAAGTTVAVT